MKMIKLSFFALLFIMSGALSAATLNVASIAGGTGNFTSTGGTILGSGTDLVAIESGLFTGLFNHHFNVSNAGALAFRLNAGVTSTSASSAISAFHVYLNGVDIVTQLVAGSVYVVSPIYNAILLNAGDAANLIVSGQFTADTSYDVTLSTPIPAAVWLFGSALMGIIGFTRRKSVVS